MKKAPTKKTQSEIKDKNPRNTLKKTGIKTQTQGHLKATNQRNQAKRDSRS